jgi:anti-anti-sigma factor
MMAVPRHGADVPGFSVDLTDRGADVVLALHGELDVAGVGDVGRATEVIESGARVTVDLRELSFIDSSGIHALMKLDVRARAEGWTLRLASPQATVRRALTLCQFDKRVPIVDAAPGST